MLRPGDVLGRYEILCPLGAGGMASVYAARVVGAASFEKLVAIKLMLPHLSGDARFQQMFADEAQVAAQVQSPHVVATIDLGRDEEAGLYQVLELVLGGSLRELSDAEDGAALPLPIALTVLAQAARGLADAHAARGKDGTPLRLVHRDVSPHNVLLGVDGRARLADFGVARAAARVSQTESGELKGKLGYASPEQLGGAAADPRSDIFSLGIVAWETLTGARLFDADNPLALVEMLMHRAIPTVASVRAEVPPEVSAVIERMLIRDLEQRVQSAAEVATRFDELARAHGGPISPEELGAFVRARRGPALTSVEQEIQRRLAAPAEPRPPRRAAAPSVRPSERSPRTSALVSVTVVGSIAAVLAGGAWWSSRVPLPAVLEGRASVARSEPDAGSPAVASAPPSEERSELAGAGAEDRAEDPPGEPPSRPRRGARADRSLSATDELAEPSPAIEAGAVPPPDPHGLLGVEEFDRE